jgi:hypothetical protein
MKLSRRGKSARRGRHTKRAGKHLRYKGKKVRASKRYHRAHKRTYKRGRRFHRGGVLPPGDDDDDDEPETELGAFALPQVRAQELTTFDTVSGQFNNKLHLYYTKTSGFTSRLSVEDKDFDVSVKSLKTEIITSPVIYVLTMTRLGDAVGKTVSFSIQLNVEYTVVEESTPDKGRREIGDIMANSITYIDSKGNSKVFYAPKGGWNGLLNVKSDQGPIYDFRTGTKGGEAYIFNGPAFMGIVNSIEKQIKTRLDEAASQTMPKGAVVTSNSPSKPGDNDTFMPRRM